MPDGLVHESEEKLRAHFLHNSNSTLRGPPQRLDYMVKVKVAHTRYRA